MPPVTTTLWQFWSDREFRGGALLATVPELLEEEPPRTVYRVTGDHRLTLPLDVDSRTPGGARVVDYATPGCVIRQETPLPGGGTRVEEWRQTGGVARMEGGRGGRGIVTGSAMLLDLSNVALAGVYNRPDLVSRSGVLPSATVAEAWNNLFLPALHARNIVDIVLGTVEDPTARYDWPYDYANLYALARAVLVDDAKIEVGLRRDAGTSTWRFDVGTVGAGVADVTVAADGQRLRKFDREWELAAMTTVAVPLGPSQGAGGPEHTTAAQVSARVASANSGAGTVVLVNPDGGGGAAAGGAPGLLGVPGQLDGGAVRRLETGETFPVLATDPATQTLTLDPAAWPSADPFRTDATAGAGKGELLEFLEKDGPDPVADAPDDVDPAYRRQLHRLGVVEHPGVPAHGGDWVVTATPGGGVVTLGLGAEWAALSAGNTPLTLAGAVGGGNGGATAARGRVWLRGSVVERIDHQTSIPSGPLTADVRNARLTTGTPLPASVVTGALLYPESAGSDVLRLVEVLDVAPDRLSATVRAFMPGTGPFTLEPSSLSGGDTGLRGLGPVAVAHRSGVRARVLAVPADDQVTLSGAAAGFAVGARLVWFRRVPGWPYEGVTHVPALGAHGILERPFDVPQVWGLRNIVGNGRFAQFAGASVPDGAVVLVGAPVKIDPVAEPFKVKYVNAFALGANDAVATDPVVLHTRGAPRTLTARVWYWSPGTFGSANFRVAVRDRTAGGATEVGATLVNQTNLQAGVFLALDLQVSVAANVQVVDLVVSSAYGLGGHYPWVVGGWMLAEGPGVPALTAGVVGWSESGDLVLAGIDRLRESADINGVSSFRVGLRDLWREDGTSAPLVLGAHLSLTTPAFDITGVRLRMVEIDLNPNDPLDTTVSLERYRRSVARTLAQTLAVRPGG